MATKTTKKTTTTPAKPDKTWNPDGSYTDTKTGKTFRTRTMSSKEYLNYLRSKPGGQLTPQEQSQYQNLMRIYYGPHTRGGKTGAGDTPRDTYGEYTVEIPNYKGSTATTQPTTAPTTTKTTTPTTPAVDPRIAGVQGAEAKGATELARLLKNKGITNDTYGITEDFNRLLAEASGKVPTGSDYDAAKIGSYYNYEDMFNNAYNTATDRGRNTAQQQFNTITPEGWTENYFKNTDDDAVLQAILGQQYNETKSNFDRQLERGQISQDAYNYAMNALGANDPSAYSGQASSAYQTLQGIGGGVLGGYRTGLQDTATGIQKGITDYSIGDTLNPGGDYWSNQINQQAQGYRSGMEGDIRKAIGNTQFFDPYSLVSRAGSVTGPSNNPLTGNVAQGQGSVLQSEDDRRTTGTSGVF